jgi:hypothetical protein
MVAAKRKTAKTTSQERDEKGLLSGVDYILEDNGLINWRKMVKPEFLVSNRDKTKETNIENLQDKDLIILLGGLKDLAQIRGYTKVSYNVFAAAEHYVCVSCTISWIPNFETENREVSFQSLASTSLNNTKDFGKLYLAEMAENRAFCRCVRNFLRVNIVSAEELSNSPSSNPFTNGGATTSSSSNEPSQILANAMKQKGVAFDSLKKKLITEGYPDAESLNSVNDISKTKIFELISRIKNRK